MWTIAVEKENLLFFLSRLALISCKEANFWLSSCLTLTCCRTGKRASGVLATGSRPSHDAVAVVKCCHYLSLAVSCC